LTHARSELMLLLLARGNDIDVLLVVYFSLRGRGEGGETREGRERRGGGREGGGGKGDEGKEGG
jgi:hypothetical protein